MAWISHWRYKQQAFTQAQQEASVGGSSSLSLSLSVLRQNVGKALLSRGPCIRDLKHATMLGWVHCSSRLVVSLVIVRTKKNRGIFPSQSIVYLSREA